MSLLESKINSIVAIALDTALNSARLDYVNETFYSKSDAVSALGAKQKNIILAPATITLGQSADYTYFVDTNSYSYPLFSSQDIVWRKKDNNIWAGDIYSGGSTGPGVKRALFYDPRVAGSGGTPPD